MSGITGYDNVLDTGRLGLGLPSKHATKMKTYIDQLYDAGSIPAKKFGIYFTNYKGDNPKLSELMVGGYNKELVEPKAKIYEFDSSRKMAEDYGSWAVKISEYKFGSGKNLISSTAEYAILDSTEDGISLLPGEFKVLLSDLKKTYGDKIEHQEGFYPVYKG